MTDQKYSVNTSDFVYNSLETKPNCAISFYNKNKHVGTLDFNGDKMTFTGDFEESAVSFLDFIAGSFKSRLDAEYQRGRYDAAKEKPLTFVQERAQLEQEWCELQALKRAYKKDHKND